MMNNSEIARKITQKGIPEGMTLSQAFTRTMELEAGYQLSERVSLARPPEIMQVQEIEEVDEIGGGQRRSRDVVCWQCGEKGHLQHDCPHKAADGQNDYINDPNAYTGKSEQVIRITQPITVATRDNIYKQMGPQRTKANLYRAGYRKTKAALQEQQRINAAMATTLTTQNTMTPAQATVAPPRVFQPRAPSSSNPTNSCSTTSYATTTSNPSSKYPCTFNTNASSPRTLSSRKCTNLTKDSEAHKNSCRGNLSHL